MGQFTKAKFGRQFWKPSANYGTQSYEQEWLKAISLWEPKKVNFLTPEAQQLYIGFKIGLSEASNQEKKEEIYWGV